MDVWFELALARQAELHREAARQRRVRAARASGSPARRPRSFGALTRAVALVRRHRGEPAPRALPL